jgi:ppGpp synthetase/RelA/SpoT-type nucleotidyltranferase
MSEPRDEDLVAQFISRYRKEYDFYDQAARLAAQILEQSLQRAGIRAIVTARAKSPSRLEQRNQTKQYQSVDAIFHDIVDLAGVRIALYFPGERDQVGKIVSQLFALEAKPKAFPEDSKQATYAKRFSGYWATHNRVRHREGSLSEPQKRYVEALIEIQVASVLMHAWAEVNHDLVYKPLQGNLSDDEHAILDELNGLVMAGEIALERLQRAGESRVAVKGRVFSNHYDLAAFLLNQTGDILKSADPEALLGRVNLLFQLLSAANKATPDAMQPYLDSLTTDFERRPLADQIIDKILAESPNYYDTYTKLRVRESTDWGASASTAVLETDPTHTAMGRFLDSWIRFEREMRQQVDKGISEARFTISTSSTMQSLHLFDQEALAEIERIRRFRNLLVHGIEVPPFADIEDATRTLDAILDELPQKQKPDGRKRVRLKAKRTKRNK